ncbi:MAG: hypothetical protein ACLFUB_03255 [Cyclobacteriaceae bacterium]
MHRYPELLKMPESGGRFYNEFKEVLPQEKFFTGYTFVHYCDDFQWAFCRYLLQEKASLYKANTLVRTYFYDNKYHTKRLTLFAVFVKEYMEETEAMLLKNEYYELMRRFEEARTKINNLINMLLSDSLH